MFGDFVFGGSICALNFYKLCHKIGLMFESHRLLLLEEAEPCADSVRHETMSVGDSKVRSDGRATNNASRCSLRRDSNGDGKSNFGGQRIGEIGS